MSPRQRVATDEPIPYRLRTLSERAHAAELRLRRLGLAAEADAVATLETLHHALLTHDQAAVERVLTEAP